MTSCRDESIRNATAHNNLVSDFEREFNTSNLVETLEPPTIATIGRAGSFNALPNASNSAANNGLHKRLAQILQRHKLMLARGALYQMHPSRIHHKVRHIFLPNSGSFSFRLCLRVRFLKQRFRHL